MVFSVASETPAGVLANALRPEYAPWQQKNTLRKIQVFMEGATQEVPIGDNSFKGASIRQLHTLARRRAWARRLVSNVTERPSSLPVGQDGSSSGRSRPGMRPKVYSGASIFFDEDQYVHILIAEWELDWTSRGLVLYSGLPRERACNWEGGGRDWVTFQLEEAFDIRWIRWLKLDTAAQGELSAFLIVDQLSPTRDIQNYAFVRLAFTRDSEQLIDTTTRRKYIDGHCLHLTMIRKYIAVGALLRVLRKAQLLYSHEIKLLSLRDHEHVYLSINPHEKLMILSEGWPADDTAQVSREEARECIQKLNQTNFRLTLTLPSGEPAIGLYVDLRILDPDTEIHELADIYHQIRLHLQRKDQRGQRSGSDPRLSLPETEGDLPPRPSLCYLVARVVQSQDTTFGDGELAAIAETVVSLRPNITRYITQVARMGKANRESNENIAQHDEVKYNLISAEY